jgi:hypothetical protein
MDGALVQIAEFSEENIEPVEGYAKADWSDVKRHDTTRYLSLTEASGEKAKLRLETQAEIVKYSGPPAAYRYWLETDGAWHVAVKQWRTRDAARIRLLDKRTQEFVWDEQRKRFIEER